LQKNNKIKFLIKYKTLFKNIFTLQLLNGDWGLGIGDWGLGIGQSPIPNPQSPIPNPQNEKFIKKILLDKIFIFLH
jgi:hypothetical protein